MKSPRSVRSLIAILVIALGLAAGASLLPDNPYQRWQLLDGTIHAHARWIYERCHFDPTSIDVVFVGPSRTEAGVDAPRLGMELAHLGLPSHVVNFSLPETGRNTNYAVVEEMLREKHPRLIVLGVTEKPSRYGHPAFKFIARRGLVIEPGYWADANYFSDLIYLPYRQMLLFLADVAPDAMGLTKHFDAASFPGDSIDTTGSKILPGGRVKEGERPASAAELERGVQKLKNGMHPPFLQPSLADIEFGDERYYVRRIAALARAHGVKVAFLFLPYYTGTSVIQEQTFYEQFGPVWNAGFLATHADWYADYGHLTRTGANHLTDWLASPVTTYLEQDDKPA